MIEQSENKNPKYQDDQDKNCEINYPDSIKLGKRI